jgi:DUF4097 and DUF4098 domain-containing protein YvlB
MRFRDLILLTVASTTCGLVLSAAPGRSRSAVQDPAIPAPPLAPAIPMMVMAPPAPSFPAEPAVPPAPPAPPSPASPSISSFEMNARRGSSTRHDGPASDCSDLNIRFNDEPAVVETEERTLSKSDAKVLHIDELENGGVQLQGWEKDVYSVTACKSADATRGDAKQLISQINLSIRDGHVSVTGPARHNDWNVYLLIRTPQAAEIELKSHNGPASFYHVDGKITARGTNGPITMSDCTGEADIEAVNGPISFSGAGGKLRLHTQNGPMSVALSGTNWSGSSLVADTVNGPVSLSVGSGFQSAFLVESRGHSPISCHASVCDDARKTWDDEHRRIEYGSGTPVIRLSTENGPVSVNAP